MSYDWVNMLSLKSVYRSISMQNLILIVKYLKYSQIVARIIFEFNKTFLKLASSEVDILSH